MCCVKQRRLYRNLYVVTWQKRVSKMNRAVLADQVQTLFVATHIREICIYEENSVLM